MDARADGEAEAAVGVEGDRADVLAVVVAAARDEEAGDAELARRDRDVGAVENELQRLRPCVVDARILEEAALGSLEATQVGIFTLGGRTLALGLAVGLVLRLAETFWILAGLACLAAASRLRPTAIVTAPSGAT